MSDQEARSATSSLPLTREEIERLATYNSEVGRGLVHTPKYTARMAELQRRFDEHTGGTPAWTT